jgi:archaellum component FlaC
MRKDVDINVSDVLGDTSSKIEGLSKTTKSLSQGDWSVDRDQNPESMVYAAVLTNTP